MGQILAIRYWDKTAFCAVSDLRETSTNEKSFSRLQKQLSLHRGKRQFSITKKRLQTSRSLSAERKLEVWIKRNQGMQRRWGKKNPIWRTPSKYTPRFMQWRRVVKRARARNPLGTNLHQKFGYHTTLTSNLPAMGGGGDRRCSAYKKKHRGFRCSDVTRILFYEPHKCNLLDKLRSTIEKDLKITIIIVI